MLSLGLFSLLTTLILFVEARRLGKRLDLFPDVYAARISYSGQSTRQTLTGACCTLLFAAIAISSIISFILPVYQNESPVLSSATLPSDTSQIVTLGKDFSLGFRIDDRNK